MALPTLCAVIAALRVLPNRSQFFQYESVALSCGQQGNPPGWTLRRNTSKRVNEECFTSRDRTNGSHWFVDALYPADTGVYWCESAAGERGDAVGITVTAASVILESPALPVTEGDAVTLRCTSSSSSSSSSSGFYKDGLLISSSSAGNLSIHRVSKSDEGLYKCSVPGAGESPHSRLTVRGCPEPPTFALERILLPVVVVCLLLVSAMLLCLWRSHKGRGDPDVPYTDVTITQQVQPNRIRDMDATPTFYSTVKLGNT